MEGWLAWPLYILACLLRWVVGRGMEEFVFMCVLLYIIRLLRKYLVKTKRIGADFAGGAETRGLG